MNPLVELRQAGLGWLDLIAGKKDVADRFTATRSGVITGLGWYIAVVVVSILTPALWLGMPDYSQLFIGVMINCLPVGGVALAIVASLAVLRPPVTFSAMFVPAVYALSFVLLVGLILSFFSGMFANALLGVLGFMLYRLARDIGKMNIGVSIAFALFGIVALVAPSFALYMLTVPAAPAA